MRAPSWIEAPLGRYYLYFAHHDGDRIRLATADALLGPWHPHEPGVLSVEDSTCFGHVASPDVHVDESRGEVRLYFHGPTKGVRPEEEGLAALFEITTIQRSKLARSQDGLHFEAHREILGAPYFRVFQHGGFHHALAMPGILYRSRDGLGPFEKGPILFGRDMRHTAVCVRGDLLHVFYTNAGDCPESILHATVDLAGDWYRWRASEPRVVLAPEREWEGGDRPLVPSERGQATGPVRQLRDPALFEQDGAVYLVYAVAGEQGLALARVHGL